MGVGSGGAGGARGWRFSLPRPAQGSSRLRQASLLAAAAWLDGCGPALLTALPMFLHPYLPRLLRAVLRLASIDSPAAQAVGLAAKAKALNRALARAVPSRQLLPAMVDAVGVASQAGSAAQVELLQLLQTHVTLRPPAEARAERQQQGVRIRRFARSVIRLSEERSEGRATAKLVHTSKPDLNANDARVVDGSTTAHVVVTVCMNGPYHMAP